MLNLDAITQSAPANPLEIETALSYWLAQLKGATSLLELPTDQTRPASQSGAFDSVHFKFDAALSAQLRQYSGAKDSTVSKVLLAGFVALLSRYSNEREICIASQPLNHSEAIQGLNVFPRSLVLRAQLDEPSSFNSLLKQVDGLVETANANANAAPSFADVMNALGIVASDSHASLAQVGFVFEANAPITAPPENAADGADTTLGHFDLLLRCQNDEQLSADLFYSTDLFNADSITRMANHLQTLLHAALADDKQALASLALLSQDEFQQIVCDWNATAADCPPACVHDLFEAQVAKTPNAPALVLDDQSLSYAELNAKANQVAHYLRSRGVGPEMLVGVCSKRSLEMIIAMLGILKAGAAYVPLDPSYPTDRLAYMIADAKPALILTQDALLELVSHSGVKALCLESEWAVIEACADHNPTPLAMPDTLAYVIYTSGSTGRPKGVQLAHRGLCNLCAAQAAAFEVTPASQVLQFASISFDAAVSETFVTLTQGACLHLVKEQSLRSGYEITKLLEKSEISVVTLPPSLLAVLPAKALPALKTLVLAGEAWAPELARIWAPGRRLLNAYGPTEGTVCASWAQISEDVKNNVTIGRPLTNVEIYILDELRQPTPIGVAGEIYIGGMGLARGYLGRPDLTQERFVAHPFSSDPSARLYRSGDKARFLRDGNIEFLGRIDHQVKLRGYRIELGEIEAALAAHPSLRDAAVIVREDHPGEKRLVAYLVGDVNLAPNDLKTHLKQSLPDYMLPQAYVFLDQLPATPNGKVDRKALPMPLSRR